MVLRATDHGCDGHGKNTLLPALLPSRCGCSGDACLRGEDLLPHGVPLPGAVRIHRLRLPGRHLRLCQITAPWRTSMPRTHRGRGRLVCPRMRRRMKRCCRSSHGNDGSTLAANMLRSRLLGGIQTCPATTSFRSTSSARFFHTCTRNMVLPVQTMSRLKGKPVGQPIE